MRKGYSQDLTAERLKHLLVYNPETGVWIRRVAVGRHGRHRAGEVAGHQDRTGYLTLRVDGTSYLGHRLAYLYMTGGWPLGQIDHINMVRNDNRWENLRVATHGQNVQNSSLRKNNRSNYKGVHIVKRDCILLRPYRARITVDRREVNLGYFSSAEEAHEAYMKAAKQYFGEFARAK